MEQEFKQKLDQRSITPSPMAWDRLDAMLTVAEQKAAPKKKKPLVMWLSIAACFIALLSGGIFFMNGENDINNINTINTPQVVTAPEKQVEEANTSLKEEVISKVEMPVAVAGSSKDSHKGHYKTVTKASQAAPGFPQAEAPKDEVVQNTVSAPAPEAVKSSRIKVDANALLASVDKPSQNNVAENSPAVTRPDVNQPKIKVNANSLLTSVEGELDQSFRGKVINSIQKNYNTVKTAVATRNRQ